MRVFVQGQGQGEGIAGAGGTLMKNPANQTIVWVKAAPERFEPRTVTVEPLDGVNVAVTSGLKSVIASHARRDPDQPGPLRSHRCSAGDNSLSQPAAGDHRQRRA